MSRTLRAGVAGAGVFGGHHARKYAAAPDVELVGIYDRGTGRALKLAGEVGVPGFIDLGEFLDGLDVLTIAAPAFAHFRLAAAAIDAGVHVYCEKPLASSLEHAQVLVERAEAAGLVLACGHQERAVFAAMGLFAAGERPVRIEAVRRNSFSGRNMDVSVVLDLMIHDLDLALALGARGDLRLSGEGASTRDGGRDRCRAALRIGGTEVVLDADRDAPERERTMRLVYPSGAVEVDFLARTFRNDAGLSLNPDFAETAEGRDPLGASVTAFLDAVRGDVERPLATGSEARDALALALAVEAAAEAQASIR